MVETEKTHYLWSNLRGGDQTVYVYLNEKGNTIYGHIVSDSATTHPYSEKSVYKKAICVGIAMKYVSTIYSENEPLGLTDINKTQYNKLSKSWVSPTKPNTR
jgi:hypothetical protein